MERVPRLGEAKSRSGIEARQDRPNQKIRREHRKDAHAQKARVTMHFSSPAGPPQPALRSCKSFELEHGSLDPASEASTLWSYRQAVAREQRLARKIEVQRQALLDLQGGRCVSCAAQTSIGSLHDITHLTEARPTGSATISLRVSCWRLRGAKLDSHSKSPSSGM